MNDTNFNFARSGADFTLELLSNLSGSTNIHENIIFAPFSLQICMALALAGAASDTATEIATVMKYNTTSSPQVAEAFHHVLDMYKDQEFLKFANKIYVMTGFNIIPEYVAIIKEQYHAEAESINFAESSSSAQTINTWVEEKTSGKIMDLVKSNSFDDKTRLVLVSTLYLQAEWSQKFMPRSTKEGDFWVNTDEAIKVQFLRQTKCQGYGSFDELNSIALEMEYKDSDLSMFILLPQERDGLQELVVKLKDVNVLDLSSRMVKTQVEISLPKFKIDYSLDMTHVLTQMGITKAFSKDDADFSNFLQSPKGIYLSNVMHKVSIEVSEEGTIAAVASSVRGIAKLSRPREFTADHPFLYWIWNKKNILFAGTFVKPPPEQA